MSNGRLDVSTLTVVDGWARLASNTAAAWNAGCAEMVALGYARPTITAPDGAYRTFNQQAYWKAYWTGRGLPGNAATPGYSNHGWGTAIDIYNVYQYPRDILRAVFARHGFTFNVPSEQWHMQHNNLAPAGGGYNPNEAEMNAEEWRQFQVMAGNVNAIASAVDQIQLAVGTLQRYVYFGGENVTGTIGDPDSIFGRILQLQAKSGDAAPIDTDAMRAALKESALEALQVVNFPTVEQIEAQLADDFERLHQNIDDQPTEFTITPKE